MELNEDHEMLIDLMKRYIKDNDMSYLAKEDLVVFWGQLPQDTQTSDWQFMKLNQVARVIKTSHCPFHLMRKCSQEILLVAFQELERVYVMGVEGHSVRKDCFSFDRNRPIWDCPYKTVIIRLFAELKKMRKNIKMLDARSVIEFCLKEIGEEIPGTVKFNRQINNIVEKETEFDVRMYENRFMHKGKSLTGYTHKELHSVLEMDKETFVLLSRAALGLDSRHPLTAQKKEADW